MNQAKEQFIFDLQLFNDEAAPAAEATPQETPTTETSAEPQSAPATTVKNSPVDYAELGKAKHPEDQLAFLKEHGFIGTDDPKPPKPEPQTSEPAVTNGQATEQPQVADEPLIEIKVNGEIKKVKQSELVEMAQKGADYTRKTQELADQRRQLDISLQKQQSGAVPPQPAAAKPADKAAQEYKAAIAETERNLGLEPGGFNQFDAVHAFELQKVTLEHNNQQIARQQVGARVQTFVQQAQQDPMSQQVDENFDTYLYKMGAEGADGAKKANAVMEAKQRFFGGSATAKDLDLLESHWNYVKTALSTPAAPTKPVPVPQVKPTVEPPRTESPGNGIAPTKEKIDYKSLGHLKQSDQLATLRKAGLLKRG